MAADESAAARLARYYDLDLEGGPPDIERYLALAEAENGPVLELMAGTGRLAIPLAKAGHAVTAVDLDPAMLARAKARWARSRDDATARGSLSFELADVLEIDLGARFALVLIALNSLFLLGTRARQAAGLRVAARHLRPGGLLVVDVWLPDQADLELYDGRLNLEWERTDPETGLRVAKVDAARHDSATGHVEMFTWFDTWPIDGGPVSRVSRTDHVRLVTAGDLAAMAEEAGLTVEAIEGDHDGGPFGPGAERALLLARLV
ncbi:MAG TPA: class I SAM-dependent methyltransferase [Candidatus Saccharimonadia bacterium]|nr:class I SAM-dependent methyltransferase [Candidatus Saccharimonadia bacterium]